MTSPYRKLAVAAGLAFACWSAVAPTAQGKTKAPQQGYTRDAQRVLAQARAASGGAGWSLLRGWHESGRQGGLPYESWSDTLRYGLRVEIHEPTGVRVYGFNGQGAWRIATDGQTAGIDERAATGEIRTEAFLAAQGFLYPGRFDAHGEFLGVRQARGHSYDVLNVQPWDASPRELWFDRRTHLLGRIVDRSGPQPITTELSDYRRIGPIQVAFHTTIQGAAGPLGGRDRQVESIVFTPADRALFSLPRPENP
jgi:hypothetical protein